MILFLVILALSLSHSGAVSVIVAFISYLLEMCKGLIFATLIFATLIFATLIFATWAFF